MKIRFTDAKFIKETDKAVCFEVEINYEFNASSSLYTTKKRKAHIWIPKSQLDKDGNPAEWIWRKNVEKAAQELNPFKQSWGWAYDIKTPDNPNLKPFKTEKELQWQKERELKISEKLNKADGFRSELITQLKGAGVKGIHSKMKSDTLIEKAREVGINTNEIMIKHGYAPKGYNLEMIKKATTLKKINPSSAIEKQYQKKLTNLSDKINKSVKKWSIARINKDNGTPSKQLMFELNALQREWEKEINEFAKNTAKSLNKQISGYVDLNLQRQLKDTLLKNSKPLFAIKMPKATQSLMESYERNLYLIKSIPADIIDKYRQGFLSAISHFDRESFMRMALEYEGISERRAKFIARDQVAKATQNYNMARAEGLGFEYYQWITSNDERVSKGKGGHIHLNNRIYKYNEPTAIIDSYGTKGHTGQRCNCRCEQIPILPNFNQEFKKVKDSQAGDYYVLVEKS